MSAFKLVVIIGVMLLVAFVLFQAYQIVMAPRM